MIYTKTLTSVVAGIGLVSLLGCTAPLEHDSALNAPTLIGDSAPAMLAEALQDDPLFGKPYIDADQVRTEPVLHRYIHGGFVGTQTKFSYYYPPARQYEGRFFQHITPVPDNENLAQKLPAGRFNKIGFAIDSGAYFVETNGGGIVDYSVPGGNPIDPTITAYRANAAAAQYSRAVAQAIYNIDARPFGYAYGGSGGGYRTVGSMENTAGVWDGAVPYVLGSAMAIPNMFTVRMRAMRVLNNKFPQIIDAVEPGGSGDMYANLTTEEADVLREVTRMGFPPASWFGYKTMGIHGFAALYQGVRAADPSYFTDFWSKPGYLGHDDPETCNGYRLQHRATITEIISARRAAELGLYTNPSDEAGKRGGVDNAFEFANQAEADKVVAFKLSTPPPEVGFIGGDLILHSGESAGRDFAIARIINDVAIIGIADQALVNSVSVGDRVQIDNSNFLAIQTYHWHQVPGPDYPVWDQFRDTNGDSLYPQRPMLIGPLFVRGASGSTMTGEVDEKMIIVGSLWDREAMPWQSDWYLKRVQRYHGDQADNQVRLYFTDHALHGDAPTNEDPNRIVSYQGMLQQALRDVAAWAEQGIAPPASTEYEIVDGQIEVSLDANERRGIQPVVTLTINGKDNAEINAGDSVTFTGTITAPPGSGTITKAEWDFIGDGKFTRAASIDAKKTRLTLTHNRVLHEAGTYFVALRGASQRQGNAESPYGQLENLGRVRVIVHAAK